MTGAEAGFLLLTSPLGNPNRKTLTTAQLRILAGRVQSIQKPDDERDLDLDDLLALGYRRDMAEHILQLLSEEQLLHLYCKKGEKQNCCPLTWATSTYPTRLKERLGKETPGCIWCKGDELFPHQLTVVLL